MGAAWERIEESLHLLRQQRVSLHRIGPVGELLGARQIAEEQQVGHLEERAVELMLGQKIDLGQREQKTKRVEQTGTPRLSDRLIFSVIPAQAGIQSGDVAGDSLDPRLRGDDFEFFHSLAGGNPGFWRRAIH